MKTDWVIYVWCLIRFWVPSGSLMVDYIFHGLTLVFSWNSSSWTNLAFLSITECRKWSSSISTVHWSSRTLYWCFIKQYWIPPFCSNLFWKPCCCTPSTGADCWCHFWLQPSCGTWWKLLKGLSLKYVLPPVSW